MYIYITLATKKHLAGINHVVLVKYPRNLELRGFSELPTCHLKKPKKRTTATSFGHHYCEPVGKQFYVYIYSCISIYIIIYIYINLKHIHIYTYE